MPTKNKWLKWIIVIAIVGLLYGLHTCKSKAESLPDHHYDSEFSTPDPNQGVYDVIESDNPEEPIFTFDPVTFDPINPFNTQAPDEIQGQPMPGLLKYDPFMVHYYLENGQAVEKWKRLNGSTVSLYPPISTSYLHGISPAASPYTSTTEAWMAEYRYTWSVNHVNQADTWFRPGAGALTYILYQDLSTSQSDRRLSKGDWVEFSFKPNIYLFSSIPEEMYDPIVRIQIMLTFVNNNGASNTITVDPIIARLSDQLYSYRYQIEQSSLVYLQQYRIELTINPFEIESYVPEDPSVIYWFEDLDDGIFNISFWHDKTFPEQVGGWFSNLISHIDDFFVPNEQMIQAWVSDHVSDELDSDNPLNLVKDLYVSLMDKFSGHSPNFARPVIHVPPLSFDIAGYGKVTPFEGYTWYPGTEGVIDGSGNNLWYYVKLSTSILIASGLIGKMWSWFKKWYDAHYAGDGGSE